jgi:hypothetical protein
MCVCYAFEQRSQWKKQLLGYASRESRGSNKNFGQIGDAFAFAKAGIYRIVLDQEPRIKNIVLHKVNSRRSDLVGKFLQLQIVNIRQSHG